MHEKKITRVNIKPTQKYSYKHIQVHTQITNTNTKQSL